MSTRQSKQEALHRLQAFMSTHVNTWEDYYNYIDTQTKLAFRSGIEPLMVAATIQMYGFLQAMREMPDEGDIKVLVGRACIIAITEMEKRMGVEIFHIAVGGEADAPEPEPSKDVTSMVADLIRRAKK